MGFHLTRARNLLLKRKASSKYQIHSKISSSYTFWRENVMRVNFKISFKMCTCPQLIIDHRVGEKVKTVYAHFGFSTGKALYFLV